MTGGNAGLLGILFCVLHWFRCTFKVFLITLKSHLTSFSFPGVTLGAPGAYFGSQNMIRGTQNTQEPPKKRHLGNKLIHLDTFWTSFLTFFAVLLLKKMILRHVPIFLRFWGGPERYTGRAHMQSVHACAVQTHFSYFVFSLKSSIQKARFWLHLGSHVLP